MPKTGALLNVFGGKITTYRHLAEGALTKIESVLGKRGPAWTQSAALPGGDFPVDGFDALVTSLRTRAMKIAPATIRRLARAYGTEARAILAQGDLGRIFGADLGEQEVDFPDRKRMGPDGRRYSLAAQQAGSCAFRQDEVAALTRYMEDALKRQGVVRGD